MSNYSEDDTDVPCVISMETTSRGFAFGKFVDHYGAECSIQMSSLASEAAIWLGIDKVTPKVLVPGEGWTDVSMPPDALLSGRMHLTQSMARTLAEMLQHFADTGELPTKSPLQHLAEQAEETA